MSRFDWLPKVRVGIATGNASEIGATRTSTAHGDRWEHYDGLPQPVRVALQQAVEDLCPIKISRLYGSVKAALPGQEELASRLYLQAFDDAQEGEIAITAEKFLNRYGTPYPHFAAGLTPLRDVQGVRVRRRRR